MGVNMAYQDSVNNQTCHSKANFATLRAYKTLPVKHNKKLSETPIAVAASRKHFQEHTANN